MKKTKGFATLCFLHSSRLAEAFGEAQVGNEN